jgi:hypothetical protein
MVCAGLERHVHRRAACRVTGRVKSNHFGVRFAVAGVKSLADNALASNDNGADHRVRRRLSPATFGERQSAPHVLSVARADDGGGAWGVGDRRHATN